MPICNKPPLSEAKSATAFDDHASEAAKMKRTREQAYFNSYNFDAIQALPYNNDGEELVEEAAVQKVVGSQVRPIAALLSTNLVTTKVSATSSTAGSGSQPQHNTLKTIYRGGGAASLASSHSNRSRGSLHSSSGRSSERGSQHSGHSSDMNGYLRRQHSGELTYTYMQRFGALLVHSRNASPSSELGRSCVGGGGGGGGGGGAGAADAIGIQGGNGEGGGGVANACEEIAAVHGKCTTEVSENGSFLLPRAMLKYQSVGNANSMPLAVNISGRADKLLQNSHNQQQMANKSSNNNFNDSINNCSNSPSSSGKTMMMTTNAISNKHTQHNNNNNSNISSNNKSNAVTNTAKTKAINTNSSSIGNSNNNSICNTNTTKNRLNYANSNDGYASLLVASDVDSGAPFRVSTATKTAAAATATATAKAKSTVPIATTSTPGAAVRVKKQSTSSTITTTTTASSSVSADEHNEVTTTTTKTGTGTATGTGTTIRSSNGVKVTTSSKTSDSKLAQSGGGSVRRGRTSSHQSHYSTDKSGSSGYYSSNVCSTYSLDEHIYCEPVIDILDVSGTGTGTGTGGVGVGAGAGKSSSKSAVKTTVSGNSNSKNTAAPTTTTAATTMVHSHARDMNSKGGVTQRYYGRRNGTAASRNGESGIAGCSELDGGEDDCDGEAGDAAASAARYPSKAGNSSQDAPKSTFGAVSKVPASLAFLLQRQTSEEYTDSQSQYFSDNLRILETSIENLDRHLKNFPSLSSHERIAAFVQTQHHHHHHHACLPMPPHALDASGGDKLASRVPQHPHHYLPTIMEGYDPANQPRRSWPDDMVDDSLLDIDLDSFLLVNERTAGGKLRKPQQLRDGGIDNPTFLTDEQEEENNYKCAKYINSCPDDAYRVESDIVAGTGTVSEKSVSVADHYMKRYEDQLHFQNTRELLEDVRDKIRLLSQASGSAGTHSPDAHLNNPAAPAQQLPHELEGMIKTLKNELENYLDRMNQHSELEIRQLCSGLVRNHNIVKMKKAFERRRSTHSLGTIESDYGYIAGNYEEICDGVPVSIREQIASIRCASDPNFKMKRKSLTEVFPVTNCYAESETLQRVSSQTSLAQQQRRPSLPHRDRYTAERRQRERDQNVITLHVPTTQLQRNLSFQQPVLSKLDAKTLSAPPADAEIGGKGKPNGGGCSSAGNGSGAESGESGDKDSILEWHRKKPSIWEMYYGTNRMNQSLLGKRNAMAANNSNQVTMSY
ncbi:probable serine/threonine-protein kinase DDB_G0282963, partial [Rhagoletis pomonella]|uniref:probable serine/threonine-protein kinase DDB_G0282963 n=1 Tax=Rhagoletis pomonella TaxID=28610 RepID=UPI0017805F6E